MQVKGSKRLLLGCCVQMMGLGGEGCPQFPHIIYKKCSLSTEKRAHSHCLVFGECAPAALLFYSRPVGIYFLRPSFSEAAPQKPRSRWCERYRVSRCDKKIVASAPTWPASRRHFDEYPSNIQLYARRTFYFIHCARRRRAHQSQRARSQPINSCPLKQSHQSRPPRAKKERLWKI